jgi:hypothetical protein
MLSSSSSMLIRESRSIYSPSTKFWIVESCEYTNLNVVFDNSGSPNDHLCSGCYSVDREMSQVKIGSREVAGRAICFASQEYSNNT